MENINFKQGHIVRHANEVGTIIGVDNEKKLVFKSIGGEPRKIYHYETFEIDLSDDQFKNMGFEIIEDKMPCKCPNLKMFTVFKLNTDEFDFEKFDYHFPPIGEGVISYEEGTEFRYSVINHSGKTYYSHTPVKTITDLQEALDANGYQIEFDEEMLWKINESLKKQ